LADTLARKWPRDRDAQIRLTARQPIAKRILALVKERTKVAAM
jgi:hypothetical protein